MKFIKENWKYGAMGVGFAFMLLYFFSPKTEEVKVPVKIKVPVPVIQKEFDTVYVPKPVPVIVKGDTVKEIDSVYYKKFTKLQDSIKRDSLFKEAITINTYKEKVEDDTLSINLNMRVRGKLLDYQVGYKTKPRFIDLDTVLKVKVPKKAQLYVGGSLGFQTIQNLDISSVPQVKLDLSLKSKKDILYNVSYDFNNKVLWGGIQYKIKL